MSQYYQYALNLIARLENLENTIGYQRLMDYLQDFKRSNDSVTLLERTGLKYGSFRSLNDNWNRAKLYLQREGTPNEGIGLAKFWPLPEIEEEYRIDFLSKDTVVENNLNLFGKTERHIGLSPDCAFNSEDFTLSPDANVAYVRSKNISRVDIFLDSVNLGYFMDMMDIGIKENLKLIHFEGMASLMVYYQINKHEFVTKVEEFTEMKIISTKFRDFSLNDGFQQTEAYLELLGKLTRLFNAINPYESDPNSSYPDLSDNDIDIGDDEASYRKKLIMAGAIDADELFEVYIVGFTIKSYWNNLGHESTNYESIRR